MTNIAFTEYCNKRGFDTGVVKLIQFALLPDNEDCLEALIDSMKGEQYETFTRIVLGEFDGEGYKLKKEVPSIFNSKPEYEMFIELLINRGMSSKGIKGNEASYIVFKDNKECKESFEALHKKIPDMDVTKLVDVVINYYSKNESKYLTILSRYLENNARLDYFNFKVKSKFWEEYE